MDDEISRHANDEPAREPVPEPAAEPAARPAADAAAEAPTEPVASGAPPATEPPPPDLPPPAEGPVAPAPVGEPPSHWITTKGLVVALIVLLIGLGGGFAIGRATDDSGPDSLVGSRA